MNFIENETAQKLRGGYYTPPDLAAWLARWVLDGDPERVLEPSCGDGAFVRALAAAGAGRTGSTLRQLVACELDEDEAAKSRASARALLPGLDAQVLQGDFLTWALGRLEGDVGFDGVVGNPPFIRYQYLDDALQARAERIIRQFGLRFTKHTNAWVPFVVASVALLRPGGRLGMVVPAELLHVLHAQSIRRFLIDQCDRVLVLDPEEIWFEGTLQGVVLLLAEKKREPGGALGRVAIQPVRGRAFLQDSPRERVESATYTPGASLPGKWMLALLGERERALLDGLARSPRVDRFADVATVAVGIVTGANKFFLVPDQTVEDYELGPYAEPMFGRSEHVPGVIYDDAAHAANRKAGRPTNFIYFDGVARAALPAGPLRYVQAGEAKELHTRYKCRIRDPWYTVPSVFTAPVGMLKRSHDYPRLVLNRAGAYTTDTAYRIAPRAGAGGEGGLSGAALVRVFVNSLTALTAELEGRHYGGGVLELVPSEINRLLIPRPIGDEGENERLLGVLDVACRKKPRPEALFALQDPTALGPLGLSGEEIDTLSHAWGVLRRRRQRARGKAAPAA